MTVESVNGWGVSRSTTRCGNKISTLPVQKKCIKALEINLLFQTSLRFNFTEVRPGVSYI